MANQAFWKELERPVRPTVADQVFEELRRQVLALDLVPGTKLSEAEVAKAMGVSRQSVRDAFFRLSKLGFLLIRPQRGTSVTLISPTAVMRAHYIRRALEAETVRVAATKLTRNDHAELEGILAVHREAIAAQDSRRFHQLDDEFHYEICTRAGLGFAWELIHEHKSHMDRVRMLSLSFNSEAAYEDHVRILDALKTRDPDRAVSLMRAHLDLIEQLIERIRDANQVWFADE